MSSFTAVSFTVVCKSILSGLKSTETTDNNNVSTDQDTDTLIF